MSKEFFPQKPAVNPQIYAFTDSFPENVGLLKIGFTNASVEGRVAQQYPTARVKPYQIVYQANAMRNDGTSFKDHDIHRYLRERGIQNTGGEWYRCTVDDVKAAVIAVKERRKNEENRTLPFKMRPEQEEAVNRTAEYFKYFIKENPGKTPHFLWNAKMRFGKTFATYKLAQKMNWKKILVMTFKPAVQNAWEEDIKCHIDFEGWQFISRGGLTYEEIDRNKPFVCFGSFQDYMGKNQVGGIKPKNEWVHLINWDAVIFDEYHYGAWRENAKELFEAEDASEQDFAQGEGIDYFDEDYMPITTNAYLYLSGTPFRAIASGEFIEEQIYNWTYSDEQKAKEDWDGDDNPYISLPRMVLLTYQLPDSIIEIAKRGEFNEFDLNIFFSAEGTGDRAKFKHQDDVQKWLNLIRGQFLETTVDNLKLGAKKPPFPFSDSRLLNVLSHTFWFLPSVASCHAMRNLLKQRQNIFFNDYKIIVAAGRSAGIGPDALEPVYDAMQNPIESKTITLSCGKLTTGVTVRPWTGIFMLRNLSTPETYFQAAFRVQSPWTVKEYNKEIVIKQECYIFDFAPNRALRQISDYSLRLNIDEEVGIEKKVADFIKFLPILAYDGSNMKQIDAGGVLDYALYGTTATLLAKKWESSLLVNVEDRVLQRLLNTPEALAALENIEAFRNLNEDIEIIINKSESIKKTKKVANEKELTKKEKKELSDEEKERKNRREEIRDKLKKLAARIPIFMYLTDYREERLKDVITQLEPALFKKVTGLTVKDFELLVSIGLFNESLMNAAIFSFRRYEEPSLRYTGINKHEGEKIGGFDTVITYKELYDKVFEEVKN